VSRAGRRAPALALALALAAAPARADEAELRRVIQDLSERVRDLEAAARRDTGGAGWAERIRLSGSANAGYYGGQHDSVFEEDSFNVQDVRLFVDAELGGPVRLGGHTLVRNAGATLEWNLVRLGHLENDVGEAYLELQGIGGQGWLNAQVGRFQIPVGEAYLRYSRGYSSKPFVTNPIGPWWWDEGVRLYGSARGGRLGYVASVSDGDTPFNADSDGDKQVTLKLFARPAEELYLSVSGLRSGRIGRPGHNASGALWLGEAWARAFGSGTGVPSFVDGVAVPDASEEIDDSWLVAADVVLDLPGWLRAWLAWGRYHVDGDDASLYDRTLHYWIAELVVEGAAFSRELTPLYLGLRANGVGTYDRDRGYLLDVRQSGAFGWNTESLQVYSLVLGWKMTRRLRLRAEYSVLDVDLVRGVTDDIRDLAERNDVFAIELGADF
jgi:hypothetical protein